MNKYTVQGVWEKTYFVSSPDDAMKLAKEDINKVSDKNINFRVKGIDFHKEEE